MMASDESTNVTRIIACAVFKPAFDDLRLQERYPDLRLTYLPSHLHLKPEELKRRLKKQTASAKAGGERVICVYGECFPDIDDFCQQNSVLKVPGHYCYEMLLGRDRFRQLLDEMTGTYFVEKDFLLNFEEYCVKPLELRDEDMKKTCFGSYRKLLYIRQPLDTDLMPRAGEVASFLGLSLDVADVDYSYLEKMLTALLRSAV